MAEVESVTPLILQGVLEYCNNWWVQPGRIYAGEYSITGGVLSALDGLLKEGQYYRIIGSDLNDGLHLNGDTLKDESFTGAIWALSIPPAVIAVAGEIADWQAKYGEAAMSPFSSESFAGYSYSKGGGGSQDPGWQSVFRAKLSRWRKL